MGFKPPWPFHSNRLIGMQIQGNDNVTCCVGIMGILENAYIKHKHETSVGRL